jgi:hypothetical protein
MPLHSTNPRKHKGTILIAQGKCINNTKVTAVLKVLNGNTLVAVPATVTQTNLGSPNRLQSWGFRYTGLVGGTYVHTVTEQTGSFALVVDQAAYSLDPPAAAPATRPTVNAPATGDEVAVVFYPYGTTNTAITTCVFADQAGNSVPGTNVQGPDGDGNWSATVDTTQNQAIQAGPGCTLTVTNTAGQSIVNNLTLAGPVTGPAVARQGKSAKKRPPKK